MTHCSMYPCSEYRSPDRSKQRASIEATAYLMARKKYIEELRIKECSVDVILIDRFVDSTEAYQGTLLGDEYGAVEKEAEKLGVNLKPDLTILLDLDVGAAKCRVIARRKEAAKRLETLRKEGGGLLCKEKDSASFQGGLMTVDRKKELDFSSEYLEKVRDRYLAIAEREPERVKVIDANREEGEVIEDIIEAINKSGILEDINGIS